MKRSSILGDETTEQLIDDYRQFLKLCRPLRVPLPDEHRVIQNRTLIRHFADVPVVLAAIDSKTDWLITRNRDHFTHQLAARISVRIASPEEFFRELVNRFPA